MKNEKGVTLILVIMILAVLTLLALGVLFIMSTDQLISKNDRLNKQAYYSAEAGLQDANRALEDSYTYSEWNDDINKAGQTTRPTNSLDDPITSYGDYLAIKKGWVVYDVSAASHLSKKQILNFQPVTADPNIIGRYTVWVRNNKSELPWNASEDNDDTVEVISLGEIVQQDPNGMGNDKILSQKMLWEEIKRVASVTGSYSQEGGSAMGGHVISQ